MRFTALLTSVALLSFAVGSPLAPRTQVPTGPACSGVTQNQLDNLVCPEIAQLNGFVNFEADNVGLTTNQVLKQVNTLLGSSNPVAEIVNILTLGFVNGIDAGVVDFLKTVATNINDLDPACKCNMEVCNNDLMDASSTCNSGTNDQVACQTAEFACGNFYSKAQINSFVPCCAQYP